MPLIKCPECSREISDKADACPHCGFPVAKQTPRQTVSDNYSNTIRPNVEHRSNHKNDNAGDSVALKLLVTALAGAVYGSFTGSTMIGIITCVVLSVIWFRHSVIKEDIGKRSKYERFIFGWKGIAVYTILAIGIPVSQNIYNENSKIEQKKEEKAVSLEKRKRNFLQAKVLLSSAPNLTDDKWIAIKNLLTSVPIELPDYNEAQKLLLSISPKINEIQEKRKQAALTLQLAEEKAQKEKEEAGLTAKGKRLRAKHPEWSVEECDTISRGKIHIGMNREQVAAAWGRPYDINKTHNAYGSSEQWVMYELGSTYVYFDDGICTSIQN